jgi:predicted alpha/beta hydrolase family esterase
MPISFRITHSALDKDEIRIELRCILAEHDYDRFVLVSHSYGSIISPFIITDQILRPKVASALLIGPVTFLLHTPDVAYNFTVRQPRRTNEW